MNKWWLDFRRIYASLGLNELTNYGNLFLNFKTLDVITFQSDTIIETSNIAASKLHEILL